jgi:hypothetical protein
LAGLQLNSEAQILALNESKYSVETVELLLEEQRRRERGQGQGFGRLEAGGWLGPGWL